MNRIPPRILSATGKVELVLAVLLVGLFLYFKTPIERWLLEHFPPVQTSALGSCRPPSEFEQLHVIVANRAGQLVVLDCMHVGAPGAYTR